jgi:hypothetical protein
MIKNKIEWINKGFFAILFVVLVLLLSVNVGANFNYQNPTLASKVEVRFKQGGFKNNLFSSKENRLNENKSDFEENEIEADDFIASLPLFSSKNTTLFNYREELADCDPQEVSFLKLPFYILFCNLKIHLRF